MRSPNFIIPGNNMFSPASFVSISKAFVFSLVSKQKALSGISILLLLMAFMATAFGQRIAVLAPDADKTSVAGIEELTSILSAQFQVIDTSLASAAFRSVGAEDPYNLSTDEAKQAGAAMGVDAFILVKGETLRRTSSTESYYESWLAFYLVSSRSGHLLAWRMCTCRDNDGTCPKTLGYGTFAVFSVMVNTKAREMTENLKKRLESDAEEASSFSEVPVEGSPDAKDYKAPIPYLRIKPEYPDIAYLYGVKGTIEAAVDLDEKGNVVKVEFIRWLGFGLEEAVEKTIRKMNWRPAERAGKPLPVHFLLRYNFKKIEKE